MTLDEVEQLAAEQIAYDEWSDRIVAGADEPAPPMPVHVGLGQDCYYTGLALARAVLAMLPVVRAAEELRTVHDADELVANRETQVRCDCELCAAISKMRAAIEEVE